MRVCSTKPKSTQQGQTRGEEKDPSASVWGVRHPPKQPPLPLHSPSLFSSLPPLPGTPLFTLLSSFLKAENFVSFLALSVVEK